MTAPEFPTGTWFTSSYSNSNGGNCVEVNFTPWHTSSYSGGNGGSCIEVAFADWQTSSYSGSNGGDCVEVALATPAVGIRDTKDRAGGHLAVSANAWLALTREISRSAPSPAG